MTNVKFNLEKHLHEPYCKPNDHPAYLHVKSDHQKHIIKHIPKMIEQRLSTLSITEYIFDTHKAQYEKVVDIITSWHTKNQKNLGEKGSQEISCTLKFIYSEKATNFFEIFTLLLTGTTKDKSKVKISKNFVAFSEFMNFTKSCSSRKTDKALFLNYSTNKRLKISITYLTIMSTSWPDLSYDLLKQGLERKYRQYE